MTCPEPVPAAVDSATDGVIDGLWRDEVFRDVVDVHTARTDLDRALLEVLAAPGLGDWELARVVALTQGPQMRRGRAAWQRLQEAATTQAPGRPTAPTNTPGPDESGGSVGSTTPRTGS